MKLHNTCRLRRNVNRDILRRRRLESYGDIHLAERKYTAVPAAWRDTKPNHILVGRLDHRHKNMSKPWLTHKVQCPRVHGDSTQQ